MTSQPPHVCEDCGAPVLAGLEPADPLDQESVVATVGGVPMVGSEWCTNLDCPSNTCIPGLRRIGINRWICTTCQGVLTGPMSEIFAHLRTH